MIAPDKTPERIAGMFDAIAPRYDLLNHVLSAGMDRGWRERAVDALELPNGARVIDLCTGTADVAVAVAARSPGHRVVGVDFAAAVERGPLWATQFHPEKSGDAGAALLRTSVRTL